MHSIAWRVLSVKIPGAQVNRVCLGERQGDSVLGLGFQGHSKNVTRYSKQMQSVASVSKRGYKTWVNQKRVLTAQDRAEPQDSEGV